MLDKPPISSGPPAGSLYTPAPMNNAMSVGGGGPPRSAQKYQKRVEKILNRLNDMQVDIEKDKQGKLMQLDK